MNALVLLFLVVVVSVGVALTYLSGFEMRLEERLGVGTVAGVIGVTIATILAAQPFGFDDRAVGLGTLVMVGLSIPGWRVATPLLRDEVRDLGDRLRRPWRAADSLRPLAIVTVASWLVTVRILSLAYQDDGAGGVVAGHLSTFGDWNAHLAYAGSFAYGDNLPPELPIAAGNRLSYHVLTNVFAADVAVLGIPMPSALVVTSGLLAMAFPLVFWFAGRRIAASTAITLTAYVLFTLSGGLGFVFAVADVARDGLGVLGDLPRTYARLTEHDIWFDNSVLAFMYAQRPGLVALPVVLIATAVTWTVRQRGPTRALWAAGLLVGASAGFSAFGFLGALGLGGWLTLRQPRRFVRFVGPALALGLPVLIAIAPTSNHVRWQVGWMANTLGVFWPWFWLLNVGLFLPLAVVVLVRRGVLSTGFDRAVAVPAWTIFVAMNLVVLAPWEWNNTHFLIIWQLLLAFPIAGLLVAGVRAARRPLRYVSALVGVTLVLSGGLDVWQATDGSSFRAELSDADGLAAAAWARAQPDDKAVYLTAPEVTEPIPSFGARRVVSGYSGWLFDLGLDDWSQRAADIGSALRGEATTDEVLARYGVDYVVIGPVERAAPYSANVDYWEQRGELVYENPGYRIYRTS